jgi:hypothetical protein
MLIYWNFRIFEEFLVFLGELVKFSDFFGVLEKSGHPNSTEIIGILEDF